jgi:hypothetical protein
MVSITFIEFSQKNSKSLFSLWVFSIDVYAYTASTSIRYLWIFFGCQKYPGRYYKLKPPLRAGWAKITVGTNGGQNFHPSVFTHYREIEERILDTMQENNSFKLPQMSN